MRKSIFSVALSLVPAVMMAQQASTSAQASTNASVGSSSMSAENQAKVDASFAAARRRNLPERPIRDRVAEGQAKGASETQIVMSAQKAEARLEASHDAMVRAGRRDPQPQEVESGYQAMAHGATSAQIETVTRHTPSNRSATVAFDAFARLEAQGMSADRAAASVVTSLDAHASDAALGALGVNASSVAGATVAPGTGSSMAGSAAGTAGSTAAGVGAGVAGSVGAVIKPPVE